MWLNYCVVIWSKNLLMCSKHQNSRDTIQWNTIHQQVDHKDSRSNKLNAACRINKLTEIVKKQPVKDACSG